MGLDPVLAWSASFVGSSPCCLTWGGSTPETALLTDMGGGCYDIILHHLGYVRTQADKTPPLPVPGQPQHSSSVAGILLEAGGVPVTGAQRLGSNFQVSSH